MRKRLDYKDRPGYGATRKGWTTRERLSWDDRLAMRERERQGYVGRLGDEDRLGYEGD